MDTKTIAKGTYADCHAATPKGATLAAVTAYGKPPPGCHYELVEQTDGSYAIQAVKGEGAKQVRQPVMREVRRELAGGVVVLHHSIAPEHFDRAPGVKFFLEGSGEGFASMGEACGGELAATAAAPKRRR